MTRTALALAHHDPEGRTAAAVERLSEQLHELFPLVVLNATGCAGSDSATATRPSRSRLRAFCIPATMLMRTVVHAARATGQHHDVRPATADGHVEGDAVVRGYGE